MSFSACAPFSLRFEYCSAIFGGQPFDVMLVSEHPLPVPPSCRSAFCAAAGPAPVDAATKTPANVARVISRAARMMGYIINLLCANSYLSSYPSERYWICRPGKRSSQQDTNQIGAGFALAPVYYERPALRLIQMRETGASDTHVIAPVTLAAIRPSEGRPRQVHLLAQ